MPALSTLAAFGALAWVAVAGPSRPSDPARCGYPSSWKPAELGRAAWSAGGAGQVYVLAWRVAEDDRPLRVESALVLKVLPRGEGYVLAHLYRWPKEPAGKRPEWQIAMTHVSGEPGSAEYPGLMLTHFTRFDTRPGNREIYAALAPREVDWSFESEEGWRVLGSGVCEAEWLAATGEKPTRFFGR